MFESYYRDSAIMLNGMPATLAPPPPLTPDEGRECVQRWRDLLTIAMDDLAAAATVLRKETFPPVPMPRMRRFVFSAPRPGHADIAIAWPDAEGEALRWEKLSTGAFLSSVSEREAAVKAMLRQSECRPRRVLAALHRIESATNWALAARDKRLSRAARLFAADPAALEELERRWAHARYTGGLRS